MPSSVTQDENPIVIVGMGCRLPGDIKCPSDLWNLLEARQSAQSKVPANRFSIDNWYHPDVNRKGGINATGGYFLSQDDSFRDFEPSFFGINPLEAASMDPQQRKLLEVVFETFESAGVTLDQVSGSQTACYVGAFTTDFFKTLSKDVEQQFPYLATGSDMTILSNRINYVFDLKGPSLTVDTACSSSLYAVHLACQGLLLGDFDAAVVAGTNIIMDVTHQLTATKLGILSPTSTCHTFDVQADGFGRAEGITALYLKRLSDALKDGSPIRGVIRASAINTNGKGLGITHPSTVGQEAVIRQAYAKAGLDFTETAYVECHGTGTPVGDPIEVSAIGNVFACGRTPENPLLLSAIKSQIGHTEGASGIAAIQKVVLSLEKRIVPATIGISRVNPAINLQNGRLKVVRNAEGWPQYAPYLRASVNSFGYGGANAHVIIDSAQSYFSQWRQLAPSSFTTLTRPDHFERPSEDDAQPSDSAGANALLISSARSSTSLMRSLKSIRDIFLQCSLPDLAYTLATKRTKFQHRAYTLASAGTKQSDLDEAKWCIGTPNTTSPRIAFVFTGQGAQWPRMGIELFSKFQVVRQTFDTLQESLDSIPERPEWTLVGALSQPASTSQMMTEVTWTVTLCTAVQIALVNLFRSWSIHPIAVVGHSSGEAAAAYCAGHLTIQESIITSYYRALALKRNPEPGVMMAVGLGAEEVLPYLHGHQSLFLACRNSPQSVTISGDAASIDKLEHDLKDAGVFARKIKSSGFANHSPLVERGANYFRQNFQHSLPDDLQMSRRGSNIPMYSCITGDKVTSQDLGVRYWAKNISAPVLFDKALQRLLTVETAVSVVIEVGPHSALAGPIRQTKAFLGFNDQRLSYLPSLTRGKNGVEDVLRLAGSLFLADYPVDIAAVNFSSGTVEDRSTPPRHIVDLPSYQWNYGQTHWIEQRLSREMLFRKHPRHDLLGSLEPSSTPTSLLWRNRLQLSDVPWISDHTIGESVLFPASGYIAMALEGVRQAAAHANRTPTKLTLKDVFIMSPMVFTKDEIIETAFELHVDGGRRSPFRQFHFQVSSVSSDSKWTQHSSGYISYEEGKQDLMAEADSFPQRSSSNLYAEFRSSGLNYGPCFRTLQSVRRRPQHVAAAKINMNPTRHVMSHESAYVIHPATMDGCLQATFAAAFSGRPDNVLRSYLPSEILSMTIYLDEGHAADGEYGLVQSHAKMGGLRSFEAECQLHRGNGRLLCSMVAKFNAVEGLSMDVEEKPMPEPYQRLKWCPDIDQLKGVWQREDFLSLNIEFESQLRPSPPSKPESLSAEKQIDHARLECLRKLIQLIVFKRPNLSILEAGYGSAIVSAATLLAINPNARYPSYRAFTFARATSELLDEIASLHGAAPNVQGLLIDYEKDWKAQGLSSKSFDIVILTINSTEEISKLLQNCRSSVAPDGQLVIFQEETKSASLNHDQCHRELLNAGFSGIHFATADMTVVLSIADAEDRMPQQRLIARDKQRDLHLVYVEKTHLRSELRSIASEMDFDTVCVPFSDLSGLPQGARTLALIELERPLLHELDQATLSSLQTLCRLASSIIWVTAGDGPEFSLMQGMAQTIRAEIPALQLTSIEVDMAGDDLRPNAKAIMSYEAGLKSDLGRNERQMVLRNGIAYISRYIIDEDENKRDFVRAYGAIEQGEYVPGLSLEMRIIGHLETSFMKEKDLSMEEGVKKGFLRIIALMHSLSRENAMTLRGLNSARHFSHECFGHVQHASAGSKFKPGDLVICLAGTAMDSDVLVPEDLCISCETEDQGKQLLGLLEPIAIAWNAVVNLGRIIPGETLLIHSNDLQINLMAYRIAQTLGAKVLMSQKPAAEMGALKQYLQVDDEAFIELDQTGRQTPAVDSLEVFIDTDGNLDTKFISDLLAPNGRLIKTSAAARNADGNLNTEMFSKGLTFSVFDMITTVEKSPRVVADLIRKGVGWFQNHQFCVPKLHLYQFQSLSEAVAEASKFDPGGRVGLKWDPRCTIPIYRVPQTTLRFPNDAVYLLVGCLGGLGQSLSLWMEGLGARNFIFLSRTADEKPEASSLVKTLRRKPGVSVKVIRGDVTNQEDVRRAVAAGEGHLRGVIQAAGVFQDSHFSTMSLQEWDAAVRPKVEGTANLHKETLEHPLDFFAMTSSSIGIIGATTQSAYAAANSYLDSMARCRRRNGLPATSLSLGMVVGVGHVEQEMGLEGVLRKRGSYGISESEFLRMMEVAIQSGQGHFVSQTHNEINLDRNIDWSLAVTGLDPTKVFNSDEGSIMALPELLKDDPRFRHIDRARVQLSPDNSVGASSDFLSTSPSGATAELLDILRKSTESSSSLDSSAQRRAALVSCILQRISSLTMIPTEKLLAESLPRPLNELGLDSIVGAEFQAWAWRELRVRLDFMEVFASGKSLAGLVDLIDEKLSPLPPAPKDS